MNELDLRQINSAVEFLNKKFNEFSFNEYGESIIDKAMIDNVRTSKDFIMYLKRKNPTADLRECGIPEMWLLFFEGSYQIHRSSGLYDFTMPARWA